MKTKKKFPLTTLDIIKETLQMTIGNRNNSSITEENIVSACHPGFSETSVATNCQSYKKWRTTFSFPKSEFICCGIAEFTWYPFVTSSLEHAQAPWLNLRFSGPGNFNTEKQPIFSFIYCNRSDMEPQIASAIAGITFKWCSSQYHLHGVN